MRHLFLPFPPSSFSSSLLPFGDFSCGAFKNCLFPPYASVPPPAALLLQRTIYGVGVGITFDQHI